MADHQSLRGLQDTVNEVTATSDQTSAPPTGLNGDVLSIALCVLLLAPCLLACFFQTRWKIMKRRLDREEQEIMAVATNQTSRRIVLDEIFKGSSKLVEFPSNKRRVQVKKYRKKTPEEQIHNRSDLEYVDDSSENEVTTHDANTDIDEELGSVEGRMIICISDHPKEYNSADDSSAASVVLVEGVSCSGIKKTSNLNEEGEDLSATQNSTDQSDDQKSVARKSPICPEAAMGNKEDFILNKLSIPDVHVDGNSRNAVVLCPKLNGFRDESNNGEKVPELLLKHSSGDDCSNEPIMPMYTCEKMQAIDTSFRLDIPIISDDEDEDEDDNDDDASSFEEKKSCQPPIFRSNETQGGEKIDQSSSNLTEVTSNVVDTGVKNINTASDMLHKVCSDLSISSDIDNRLKNAIPLKKVVSSKTETSSRADTCSHISYFSFEDETIASDQADMCAICICPYYENDVQIFSKRCPHSFHKDCLFEWLVKGHDECPCCRTEMVSKSEVKETSASLIGTERLAQALASTMVETPPHRFRQTRIARQMFARARQMRRRIEQSDNENESSPRQNTTNSHWLWNARFETMPAPARSLGLPSVNEAPPSPAPSSPVVARTTQLQSRSFDAMTNSRPTDNLATRSFDAITDPQGSQVETPTRNTAANSRNFHNHWSNWNNAQLTPRRSNRAFPEASSPLRRRRNGGDAPPPAPLPVTVLPTS